MSVKKRMSETRERKRNSNVPSSYLLPIRNGKVFLIRRYNTGYEDGKYSVVAGHLEVGESFTEAVIREAWEEAGIRIKPEQVAVAHVMHRNDGPDNVRMDTFFVLKEWEGELGNNEPDRCDHVAWFPLDNLPENMVSFVRQALEHIRHDERYSEFGWDGTNTFKS